MTTSKILDRGAIELLGPFGLTNTLLGGSQSIAKLDTSRPTDYALYIVIGLLALVLLVFSGIFFFDFRIAVLIIVTTLFALSI